MSVTMIVLFSLAGLGLMTFLGIKNIQNSTLYNAVTPHSDVVETSEGGWREIVRKRNSRAFKAGCGFYVAVVVMTFVALASIEPARKVQAALWPTATPTQTPTRVPTRTRTPSPTSLYTTTPRPTSTPIPSETPLTTATPKVIIQQVYSTVIVQKVVTKYQTVVVYLYQTVIVTPTWTPVFTDTPSLTPTPTLTETPTPTPTSTEITVTP
jgi:hypothetical protein